MGWGYVVVSGKERGGSIMNYSSSAMDVPL